MSGDRAEPTSRIIRSIELSRVRLHDRLRPVDEGHVQNMMATLKERGQICPIEVFPQGSHYEVIVGAHRQEAARRLGWTVIDAEIRGDLTPDERRLREIDENLFRHELNPLDRAASLAEREEIYVRLHPETKKGGDRGNQHTGGKKRQTDTVSVWQPFTKDAERHTGLDERSIRRSLKIAKSISKDLRRQIAGTWLALKQGELLHLAKQPPGQQAKLLKVLLREKEPAQSVRAAIAIVEGRKIQDDPVELQVAKLLDAWNRAGGKAKKRFINHLRERGEL